RLAGAGAEQLDHSPGAGADVDQTPERPLAQRAIDGALDLALCDMERADLVPDFGMTSEIAVGGFGALGADGLDARSVGGEESLRGRVCPGVDQREQRLDPLRLGERQEYPAALLAPLQHARVRTDLQMA